MKQAHTPNSLARAAILADQPEELFAAFSNFRGVETPATPSNPDPTYIGFLQEQPAVYDTPTCVYLQGSE